MINNLTIIGQNWAKIGQNRPILVKNGSKWVNFAKKLIFFGQKWQNLASYWSNYLELINNYWIGFKKVVDWLTITESVHKNLIDYLTITELSPENRPCWSALSTYCSCLASVSESVTKSPFLWPVSSSITCCIVFAPFTSYYSLNFSWCITNVFFVVSFIFSVH